MREKKGFLLQTVQQMNAGAIVSGLGFLLYLALSALGQETAADIAAVALGMVSVYVFVSVALGRSRDKEAVSYSLLWGTGALALLLGGCHSICSLFLPFSWLLLCHARTHHILTDLALSPHTPTPTPSH